MAARTTPDGDDAADRQQPDDLQAHDGFARGGERQIAVDRQRDDEVEPGAARKAEEHAEHEEGGDGERNDHAAQLALQRDAEHVDERHDAERAEHVRILEGAGGSPVKREQIEGAGQQAEIADDRGGAGDDGGDRPRLEDQLRVEARRSGDEGGNDDRGGVEIERHGDVDQRRLGVEREGGGEQGAGAGDEPKGAVRQQRAIEGDEADGRQQHDEADAECVDRRRLGEHDAAGGEGERDGGERQPGDEAARAGAALITHPRNAFRSCGDSRHATLSRAGPSRRSRTSAARRASLAGCRCRAAATSSRYSKCRIQRASESSRAYRFHRASR